MYWVMSIHWGKFIATRKQSTDDSFGSPFPATKHFQKGNALDWLRFSSWFEAAILSEILCRIPSEPFYEKDKFIFPNFTSLEGLRNTIDNFEPGFRDISTL